MTPRTSWPRRSRSSTPKPRSLSGPATETGFYYDFARAEPFTPEDLERIEERMREIVRRDEKITREVWDRDAAIAFFDGIGESYKAEYIGEIPAGEEISLYRQGDFVDLCVGPHLPSTGHLGQAFKLMNVAGAYWRGDPRNAQLQRVYGTAWASQKELDQYLFQLEEAERRDHRRLGRELDLFHIGEEAVGSVFWHPKGWTLFRIIENYLRMPARRGRLSRGQRPAVARPQPVGSLRTLGEIPREHVHRREPRRAGAGAQADELPGPCTDFPQPVAQLPRIAAAPRGIRQLPPQRAVGRACTASCGCAPSPRTTRTSSAPRTRSPPKSIAFCKLLLSVYRDFGFEEVAIKFADRPPVRAGSDEVWDRAEAALRNAVEAAGLTYTLNPGEGAFYGPKLEFVLARRARPGLAMRHPAARFCAAGAARRDLCRRRRRAASPGYAASGDFWLAGTLHRRSDRALRRRFPLWLAPGADRRRDRSPSETADYAAEVARECAAAGLRVELDAGNEKITYKVREHSLAKVPIMLVVGRREAANRSVALRRLGGKEQEALALGEAVARLKEEAAVPSSS